MKSKPNKVPAIQLNSWEFRYRADRDDFRVWRTDWAGDQFEILSTKELEQLQFYCHHFSIAILEADEE